MGCTVLSSTGALPEAAKIAQNDADRALAAFNLFHEPVVVNYGYVDPVRQIEFRKRLTSWLTTCNQYVPANVLLKQTNTGIAVKIIDFGLPSL
jgi:activator of HSP90 ATPase